MECDLELSSVRHVSIISALPERARISDYKRIGQMQLSYSMGVGVTLRRALGMPLNA